MKPIALETLGGGALRELFEAEVARILANIADPNTDTGTRLLTISIAFKPNRERDSADVKLSCSSKLAGVMNVETKVFMGKQHGQWIAVEHDPRQSGLFDEERTPLTAVQFQKPEAE